MKNLFATGALLSREFDSAFQIEGVYACKDGGGYQRIQSFLFKLFFKESDKKKQYVLTSLSIQFI